MTPDEYRQLADIFERLRELPESQRAAALDSVCAGRSELREQVSRLLGADRKAEGQSFLERRAIEDVARLLDPQFPDLPSTGTEIGIIVWERVLERGVWVLCTKDKTSGCNAASQSRYFLCTPLKTTPKESSGSNERPAQPLLNHPNIVSIFDADFDQGFYYIATEFIEGKTLRQLLAVQPRGLDSQTILEVVAQTASALRVAHETGIVHRDIKPENIMLRPDGFLKVLDFGLAKLGEPSGRNAENVPELWTRPGHLPGDLHYLSPEQVSGKTVDPRSDLFSLGVVAYELSTGARPFEGATDGAIYEAILNRSPAAPSSIRPSLGAELDAVVLRLLEKDPELRYQTAGDLRSSCMRLSRNISQQDLPQAQSLARPLRWMGWWGWKGAVAGAILCAAAATSWYVARSPIFGRRASVPGHFQRLTDSPGEENSRSLSPDGKQFVYASARAGKWDIYLQRTGGSTSINLTHASGEDDTQPDLSPDGSRIVFRSNRDGGGLFVMELTGENPRRISRRGYLPSWAPDGQHVVYSSDTFTSPSARGTPSSRLSIIDLADGSERTLETGDAIQPKWSPSGDRIAYWGITAGGRRDIFTVAASGPAQPEPVTSDDPIDWYPVWSPTGDYLYFLSNRSGTMNVWRVAIDERTGRTQRAPEPVTVPAQSVDSLSLGRDGKTLLFSQASQRYSLARIGFDPASRSAAGVPEAVAAELAVSNISFSPDGARIVFDTLGEASEELWIMNRDGADRRLLLSDAHRNRVPQWSPDGQEILFFSDRSGQYGIWSIRKDGSGLRALTTPKTPNMQKAIWSPEAGFSPDAPEPAVVLDPHPPQQALSPEIAPGLRDAGTILRRVGPPAQTGPGDCRIVIIGSGSRNRHLLFLRGAPGAYPCAREIRCVAEGGKENEANDRYFVFLRETEGLLYDRRLKRETRLFSSAPSSIYNLALSVDCRWIYFTKSIRDADLWLAHLDH